MELRPFRPSDLDALYEIDRACFPPGISYSRREMARYVRDRNSRTWIAEEGDTIMGFVIAECEAGRESHIITIDVVSEWRRRGVATRLMDAAEEWARQQGAERVYLETAEDNLPAQQFYQGRGYERVNRIEGYYSNGAAWVMVKRLGQGTGSREQATGSA